MGDGEAVGIGEAVGAIVGSEVAAGVSVGVGTGALVEVAIGTRVAVDSSPSQARTADSIEIARIAIVDLTTDPLSKDMSSHSNGGRVVEKQANTGCSWRQFAGL